MNAGKWEAVSGSVVVEPRRSSLAATTLIVILVLVIGISMCYVISVFVPASGSTAEQPAEQRSSVVTVSTSARPPGIA